MPFDTTQPIEGNTLDAGVVRANLVALFDLIQAMASITRAQVDGVATLDPGQGAAVSLAVNGQTLHLIFGIPRGADGTPGAAGSVINGAVVNSVSSVDSADQVSASVSYDGALLHFSFAIPRGIHGVNGVPGKVTNAALDGAIAWTSSTATGWQRWARRRGRCLIRRSCRRVSTSSMN